MRRNGVLRQSSAKIRRRINLNNLAICLGKANWTIWEKLE